jgi:hypothetical protein
MQRLLNMSTQLVVSICCAICLHKSFNNDQSRYFLVFLAQYLYVFFLRQSWYYPGCVSLSEQSGVKRNKEWRKAKFN